MLRHDMVEIVGKEFLTSNIEAGEYSYVQAAGGKAQLEAKVGHPVSHFKLDIRFEMEDVVVLIETKQNYVDDDEKQLREYLEEERAIHPGKKAICILANTNNDKIKVWKSFVDDEHILKDEAMLDRMSHYVRLFKINKSNDRETVLKNTYSLNELLHKKDIDENLRSQFVGTSLLYIKDLVKKKGAVLITKEFVDSMKEFWSLMTPKGIRGAIEGVLHEKFKEIIEEEMINDAIEYGYEAIQRTPDSGEHRKRSDISEFREMAAERQDLKELQMEVNDAVADNQLREFALEQRENSVKRQKALNDEKSKEINERDEEVRKKEMAFSEKNSELILRESNVLIKESEIDEREEKLKKKQEQDEKDFQMKEDKMEAQQRAISEREKSISERENSVAVKENEVAQKSAEYSKKLVLLDSLIEDVQSYKSPVSIAKNVLEILKESMNEKGKRVTSNMIGVLTRNTDMLNRKYQVKINETRVKREQIQQGTYFDMSDEQDEREDRSL